MNQMLYNHLTNSVPEAFGGLGNHALAFGILSKSFQKKTLFAVLTLSGVMHRLFDTVAPRHMDKSG